jgi:hypothetical protein
MDDSVWNITNSVPAAANFKVFYQERPENAMKILIQREHLPKLAPCAEVRLELICSQSTVSTFCS